VEAPLLRGEKFAKELNLNVSARITDDEIYGSNSTYSAEGRLASNQLSSNSRYIRNSV
jgi:hypothetical protein